MSVDPGEGYRLLLEGERILDTDEVWLKGEGPWTLSQTDVPELTEYWNRGEYWAMRRKIPGKQIHLYTTCNDLGVINGASVYASELPIPFENVVEIKIDPSTGTLYVEDGHGRPAREA